MKRGSVLRLDGFKSATVFFDHRGFHKSTGILLIGISYIYMTMEQRDNHLALNCGMFKEGIKALKAIS